MERFLKVNYVNHIYSSETISVEKTTKQMLDPLESMMINDTKVQKKVKESFMGFPTSYKNEEDMRL